jgi:hypothetical protein
MFSPLALHTPVELEVTDLMPSPLVLTVALNLPLTVPVEGRFEMVGILGVARPTLKVVSPDDDAKRLGVPE